MSFFPYASNLLRCHPLAAAMQTEKDAQRQGNVNIRTLKLQSHKVITICCTRCPGTITGRVSQLTMHSNQCAAHHIQNRKSNRPRYRGKIPSQLSRPIRAGILLHVDHNLLQQLVASLEPLSTDVPDAAARLACAAELIDEIRLNHSDVQLADNCYWGDNSSARKGRPAYRHPRRKRPRSTSSPHPAHPPPSCTPSTPPIEVGHETASTSLPASPRRPSPLDALAVSNAVTVVMSHRGRRATHTDSSLWGVGLDAPF